MANRIIIDLKRLKRTYFLHLLVLVNLYLIIHVVNCDDKHFIDDDELFEMEDSELGLKATEVLINYYNQTMILQDQYKRLALYNPFEDGINRADSLLERILDLKKKYKQVQKLLKNSNPIKIEEGKRLYNQALLESEEYTAEQEETLKFLDFSAYMNTNPAVEKAKEEYESMLPQIQKLTGVMRDDFLDAAYLLNSRKLFPDISEPDDMAKEARALKDNKANFEVIMELYNLFKEWEVLSLKQTDALMDEQAQHVGESMELIEHELHELTKHTFPDFLKENEHSLSKFVAITLSGVNQMEYEYKLIDIDESLGERRGLVVEKVMECYEENNEMHKEKKNAKILYEKLENGDRDDNNKHTEL